MASPHKYSRRLERNTARPSPWRDLREGIAYVWSAPQLLAALLLAFLVNMTAYPLSNGLLPYVAKEIYGIDQAGLGYLVASWPLMGRLLALKTDAGTPAIDQMVLAEFCAGQSNGGGRFDKHVVGLRKVLKRKLDVLVEALQAEFGTTAEFELPDGGIFLWVKLPEGVDTMRLFQAASKEGVAINPGVEWSSNAEAGKTRMRLCFANPSEEQLRQGVAKLAEICHREFGVPLRGRNAGRHGT